MTDDDELRGDVRRATSGKDTYVHGDRGEPAEWPTQATPSRVGAERGPGPRGATSDEPGRGTGTTAEGEGNPGASHERKGRRKGGKGGGEQSMVPRERPTSYYGRPIVKSPVWKPEIPFYFFFGGLAGASACLAATATFAERHELARRAWFGAFVGVTVSPVLLIKDLGQPKRFLYMLRMVKVTSPMSLGAWILAANGGATTLAAGLNLLNPKRRGGPPEVGAALIGAPLATYTAALITNSAIPAWSEARAEMPFVFGASAASSAAGAALLTVQSDEAEPARALGIAAVVVEEAVSKVMLKRLGPLASAYEEGLPGKLDKAARGLSAAGALALAVSGRHGPGSGHLRRRVSAAGGALLLAGAVCKRWSIFKAGFASAEDPHQTIDLQRDRLAAEDRPGA